MASVRGYQERRRQENRATAYLLYRYGMTFTPGEFKVKPEIYEVFPLWDEEEIKEMQLEKYKNMMLQRAASPVKKVSKPDT